MPNVNDLNEFLTAQEVKNDDVVTFLTAGEITETDFSKNKDGSDVRKQLVIEIGLANNSKVKKLAVNKTSRKALSEKYGPESEKWVGKTAKIVLLKQNVGGQIRDVIYLQPVA